MSLYLTEDDLLKMLRELHSAKAVDQHETLQAAERSLSGET